MTGSATELISKTNELEEELKATGLWINEIPSWVMGYDESAILSNADFAQWLQFVFIPNHLQRVKPIPLPEKKLIVPNAIKYFGNDVNKGKLLRILVEIDALL